MRAHLIFIALLAACATETNLTPDPDPVDPGTDTEAPDTEEPIVEPEAPRFYLLDVPYAPAVSENHTVLLFDGLAGGEVYLWTEAEGLDFVTTTGASFNSVHDLNADATMIIGSYGNYTNEGENTQAAIYTVGEGWEKLGAMEGTLDCPMQSAGWSLTADGTTAVGLAFVGCNGHGMRWTEDDGLVGMAHLASGSNRASRISRNGALTVGFAQGNASRTPAAWYPDGTGEVLNANWNGELYGVNADGTKAVGQIGTKAIVWSPEDGHRFLGNLGAPGQTTSTAYAICGESEEVIFGKDTLSGGLAFAWTEATGMVDLEDWLEEKGVVFPPNTRLNNALACSPDLRVITGQGAIDDRSGTWVVVLPDHLFEEDAR